MRISLKLAKRILKEGRARTAYPPFRADKWQNVYIRVERTGMNRVDWYKPDQRGFQNRANRIVR